APHVERDVVVGDDAWKLLADPLHLEDEVVGHEIASYEEKEKRAGPKPALFVAQVLVKHCRNLELVVDDLRLELLHQLDPRRMLLRDLRGDLANAHPVVLEVEDEVLPALEVALRRG